MIRAPRQTVWQAWTEPDLLARWWVPTPTIARVDRLDVRPGGAFVTSLSDDGHTFVPHTDSIFLVVEPERSWCSPTPSTAPGGPLRPRPWR